MMMMMIMVIFGWWKHCPWICCLCLYLLRVNHSQADCRTWQNLLIKWTLLFIFGFFKAIMLGLCWLPLELLLNNSQLRKTTVNSSKVLLFIRFCVCLSYFLIVILHVDDKTYGGFVNKAFGRQFLCDSLHFHSQLAVGFRAVFVASSDCWSGYLSSAIFVQNTTC